MIEKTGAGVTTIALAIERASTSTGADFDFLMRTAARESGFNPEAKASTSSATGLFQFIDQSWLGMMKQHGAEHGLKDLADQITQTKNGRYVVADRQARRDILALRTDPEVSSIMAGEFSEDARSALKSALGRDITDGELYAAHFLGPAGAIDLIKGAQRGETSAAALFPEAARANRTMFYTRAGTARSPGELIALLEAKQSNAPASKIAEIANKPLMAKIRPTTDTMDDIVSTPYAPVMAGRPMMEPDDYGTSDGSGTGDDVYTAEVAPSVMTPFMAQLLASLDPIPDRIREAMFRADFEDDGERSNRVEEHA